MSTIETSDPVLTQRYVKRFQCIAERCEDDCCHSWDVTVKRSDHRRLVVALGPERVRQCVRRGKDPKKNFGTLQQADDGRCGFQRADGLCEVHAEHGHETIPDVCATYPRRVVEIDGRKELTACPSCPEVSRQLLLHDDALAFEVGDAEMLSRAKPDGVLSTASSPYVQWVNDIRAFFLELLELQPYSLDERLLLMVFFANRTVPFLHKDAKSVQIDDLAQAMHAFSDAKYRDDLIRPFTGEQVPSHLAMPLIQRVLRLGGSIQDRQGFRELVVNVLESYTQEGQTKRPIAEVWEEYQERRTTVLERFGPQVDRIFGNFVGHYWVYHPYPLSKDLLRHTISLLVQLAVQRFLLFSHPGVADDVESLERAAVEVVYRCQRIFLHTKLLPFLEDELDQKGFISDAGAIYLTKF